jgi:ketosteroid isomerase-like protein
MEASGLEQLGVVMAGWLQPWQRPAVIEADEFIEEGSRIAVLIRWKGRGRQSGTPMESEGAHLWTFRDGKAVRYDVYRDRGQALAALRGAGDPDH